MEKLQVSHGLLGVCVGDALGVPVEFISRAHLQKNPLTEMIGYGTHNQPPGTWSDDSSLTLCLAESLCEGYNLHDIADRFCRWLFQQHWTPYGKVFDIGMTTREVIFKLQAKKCPPQQAGGKSTHSNGNGALMRILPMAYFFKDEEFIPAVHDVSAITHGHPRSQVACSIYIYFAIELLRGKSLSAAYQNTANAILQYYFDKQEYAGELKHYQRILENDIGSFAENEIKSGGYVVETLEAALWCLLTEDSYAGTVLKAVNLGGDTDTTGAVAGGLAGIYYGIDGIPGEWLEQIARKQEIIELAQRLQDKIAGIEPPVEE